MDEFRTDLFKQGAESKVYKGTYFSKPAIFKERFVKTYRHPDLDRQLTHERIKAEARALRRCRSVGIPVPSLYFVDLASRLIVTAYLEDATTIRETIANAEKTSSKEHRNKLSYLMNRIGVLVASMHKEGVIHGDLTTSNLMVQRFECDAPIVSIIDFGLSFMSDTPEDKGVDLYVLERAFLSTHPGSEDLFQHLIASYAKLYGPKGADIMKKYEDVKRRGRKRNMVG
uniref:non-specific serine/threonine protein kinase n=1 Tax=Ornithodoros turicata TaxID=34597 RepID=A0A2R5LIB5_9ACAR